MNYVALIDLHLDEIIRQLEVHWYITPILLDLSIAFDVVDERHTVKEYFFGIIEKYLP